MNLSLKHNIDSRDFNESACALQSHVVPPAVQLNLKECLSQIGLACSASQLINCQLQFTGFGNCRLHVTFFTYTHVNQGSSTHFIPTVSYCFVVFWDLRTSLPTRSSWFSTMPHGAMPMVQIFPLDLEAWSFSASPTWRITPVSVCGCVCAKIFRSVWENDRETVNKISFVTINTRAKLRYWYTLLWKINRIY